MTTPTLTPSQTLDLTPKKKSRRGKYDQEALDTLLAKAEKLPEQMTPAMEEAVRKYEEKIKNNPYAKNYQELLKILTPDQQKEMKKNIQLNPKWGIDIIPMNIKNMKPLTATPNNETIFDGSHVDQYWKTGIKGVTYLTGKAAENEVRIQWKKLLKDKSEVEQFINFLPGETTKEKILNFAKLFDLKKTGYWHSYNKKWDNSEPYDSINMSKEHGSVVYWIEWENDLDLTRISSQDYPSPFFAFDDYTKK